MRQAVLMAFLAVAACTTSGSENHFETGAGLSLHVPSTSTATKDLQDYYRELCLQASPLASPSEASGLQCESLNVLVRTGFNDIDLRCDRYLAWIDRKRIEGGAFKSGVTATNTLLAGVVTGSERTLRDIALALGFATSIYDTYNNALLNGIESSTIKTLVYERRRAYRIEFTNYNYTNFADATYALRGYLRICTPQTIVLSANEYVVAGISGTTAASPSAVAKQEMAVLSRVAPNDRADTPVVRPAPEGCPECGKIFAREFGRTREPVDVRTAQRLLCLEEGDGKVGPRTLAALRAFDEQYGKPKDGLISNDAELDSLEANGCSGEDRQAGYRSVYEKNKLTNLDTVTSIIDGLNGLLGLTGDAAIRPGTTIEATLKDDAFRKAIADARAQAIGLSEPNLVDPEEYTAALDNILP